ncbi:RloB family protein [Acinetobacter chinensis]|uniref:RloB family protein n=1 Tax=Acinetobacter chinensis TaxID=2004650 RepID=UPI0029344F1C|nr:RloB family protein [Acinetobacter chinensis]WOE40036.1 RloB family protein [Acinetobacter chinensis]
MPRDAIPFERTSSVTDVRKIFLIAAEGFKTEYYYLNALNERYGRVCRLLPFKRPPEEASHSAPNKVLEQLKREASKLNLKKEDSCWLVVDRDSWGQLLTKAINECKTLKYNSIVSAPCFEVWLLFYFKKLDELSEDEKSKLILNEYVTTRETYIEKLLTSFMKEIRLGQYKANKELPEFFFVPNNIQKAINEAHNIEKMEILNNGSYEFPTLIGSQIYKMLSQFFQENLIGEHTL